MTPRRNGRLAAQGGYTLVELIVAAAIFIIISVAAVGVLVSVLNSSSKTAAQRAVQQDVRVNIEEIARTVRASSVDYEFYEKAAAEGESDCALPGNASGSKALPLFWTEAVPGNEPNRKRVIFFYDDEDDGDDTDGAIYRYETAEGAPTPSCDQIYAAGDKIKLTSPNVATSQARFFVSPLSSPYKDPCANPLSACQVRRNTHPRVTMLATVQTKVDPVGATERSEFSETTIQTTIGTRAYPITGLVGQQ